MSREEAELYVTGNYDGDVAAFERAIAGDPALAEVVADEARFEMLLRDAVAHAQFCAACEDVVRGERCDTCGAAVRPGGYIVERVLVSNAHGRMYLAHDADGKQVALKELAFVQAPTASTIEAFEREARFLRALEHPAIPRFVASFEEGRGVHTRYYLAQELVRGKALDQLDDHWYTEAEIVDVARQVLSILVYLQSLSPMVIHRDIKPANLVRRDDGTIALVDFGAAYVDGSTAGVTTIGTFGYMPIEQLAGLVDATTDVFALGSSLLYLLTRQEPWRLAQSRVAVNVSAPLRAFLDKLVAPNPRDRFASAKEALVALDARDALVRRPRRAWVRPAAIAAATLVLSLGGITGYYYRSAKTAAEDPERPVPVPAGIATLRIAMPPGVQAELFVDDKKLQAVQDGLEIPINAGVHEVKLLGPNGAKCEAEMKLPAGKTTTVQCRMQTKPFEAHLDIDRDIDVQLKDVSIYDAVTMLAKQCGLSVVIPAYLDVKVSAQLTHVPCNKALESILEAQGLWYVYTPTSKLAWIGPRKQIDADREAAMVRGATPSPLPVGKTVNVDLKKAPLRQTLALLAGAGGANLVIPDNIEAQVNVQLTDVPWNHAFEAILDANGLWYRYTEAGKIIRVSPRKQIDAEDEAAKRR